jgi:8-oxo-dGTP pyrophosphatase MutT (NUDIX family)
MLPKSPIEWKRLHILQKVTALITRTGPNGPELLVFRHPQAGVQLPAGTVEHRETITDAVLREVQEETGLTNVVVSNYLGSESRQLPDDWRLLLQLSKLFDAPAFDASSLDFTLTRGSWVRVIGEEKDGNRGRYMHVCYEEFDLNQTPPQLHRSVKGWLRSSVLTNQLERHFFHLITTGPTLENWYVFVDNHTFQLYWTPLNPKPQLVQGQQEWLDSYHDKLLNIL